MCSFTELVGLAEFFGLKQLCEWVLCTCIQGTSSLLWEPHHEAKPGPWLQHQGPDIHHQVP